MMISSRGRYALRVMTDLAQGAQAPVPLKEIAARQEISQKYLESIMCALSRAHLVDSAHGKGGGYRLSRAPEAYTVGEILRVTEGSLAPVSCLAEGCAPCARVSSCPTRPMWTRLDGMIEQFFNSITLADLSSEAPQV
jgi:Rrf2 family protein